MATCDCNILNVRPFLLRSGHTRYFLRVVKATEGNQSLRVISRMRRRGYACHLYACAGHGSRAI
jgi:hypothetical protein